MSRIMNRKRPQSRAIADAPFISRISEIKADRPLWGYRRVWAYMRFRDGLDSWVLAYNTDFPHQLLRYKTTRQSFIAFVDRKVAKKEVLALAI